MRAIAAALAAGLMLSAAQAEPSRPVVVELFTSQGCSSCPPADALLGELARDRPDVLALAFHVTYWDSLGWKDPYAFEAATQRQRRYAATLSRGTMYTPQMVVDGGADVVGSDRPAALAAIRAAAARSAAAPLRVARSAGELTIEVGAASGAGTVWVVGYDPQRRTAVARGENAGRSLVEYNIVRSLAPAGDWQGAAVRFNRPLPEGEQAAVLIQAADGRIIGAARAPAPGS